MTKLIKSLFIIVISASMLHSAYLPWPMFMHDAQRTGLFTPTIGERGTMDSTVMLWIRSIPSYTSPAIGNIDTDNDVEIIVGGTDAKVYALKGTDGTVKWSYTLGSSIYTSSPAIGDIDGDSAIEIVVGTQSGIVYSIKGDGSAIDWSRNINSELSSAPVIGNVDNDTTTIEVVISFVDSTKCLRGTNGTLIWAAQTGNFMGNNIYSSPSIGNIDSNSATTEVILASNDSYVYALNGNDGSLLWKQLTEPSTGGGIPPMMLFTSAIKDIDNDGVTEVIVNHSYGIYSLTGTTGAQKWNNPGYGNLLFGTGVNEAVAIGDIDGDSLSEVVIRSHSIKALDPLNGTLDWNYNFPSELIVGSNPILADIEGDKKLEVIGVNHAGAVTCLEGETGTQKWIWNVIGKDVHPTQAIGDIDGDGCVEIVGVSNEGPVYALDSDCPLAVEETKIILETFKVLPDKNNITAVFSLIKDCNPSITILDISGREKQKLTLGNLPAGQYRRTLNTKNLNNGIYFIQFNTPNTKSTKKLLILK